jgi:hypothetical protein
MHTALRRALALATSLLVACGGTIGSGHDGALDGHADAINADAHEATPPDAPNADSSASDVTLDAPSDHIASMDVPTPPDAPPPTDVVMMPDVTWAPGCTGSASGTSSIWTCTTDHHARQRCVTGMTETEPCSYGCISQPLGVDDYCATSPPPPGSVSCAYPQWWNFPYSWTPGYYAITGTYNWDNDLRAARGTPVQLRHASQLVRQGVYAWGWMPQWIDQVTGEHFAMLHLQPQHQLTTTVGMIYPAGTLVGYSGGDTTDTGYCVAIPGCGTPNCATATCVYSTGAHLCIQTVDPFHTAFPTGMDACM